MGWAEGWRTTDSRQKAEAIRWEKAEPWDGKAVAEQRKKEEPGENPSPQTCQAV